VPRPWTRDSEPLEQRLTVDPISWPDDPSDDQRARERDVEPDSQLRNRRLGNVGHDDRRPLEPFPLQERIRDQSLAHVRGVRVHELMAPDLLEPVNRALRISAAERDDRDVGGRQPLGEEPVHLGADLVGHGARARAAHEADRAFLDPLLQRLRVVLNTDAAIGQGLDRPLLADAL